MNLDENQKKQVAVWLSKGSSLAEVQNRLESEFDVTLTYMEVKFLVADLDLTPVDPEPETPAEPAADASPNPDEPVASDDAMEIPEDDVEAEPGGAGTVSVEVDQLARPGAMISGKVTFGNGKTNEWMLDQMGRLGVVPGDDGYKPSQADLQQFQHALQDELKRMGL